MSGCNQLTITDAAFVNLKGIHTLDMLGCRICESPGNPRADLSVCPPITGTAFEHLRDCDEFRVVLRP